MKCLKHKSNFLLNQKIWEICNSNSKEKSMTCQKLKSIKLAWAVTTTTESKQLIQSIFLHSEIQIKQEKNMRWIMFAEYWKNVNNIEKCSSLTQKSYKFP